MEEGGTLGRWSTQGVGSELDPEEWSVMGEPEEECLDWNLEVEGEGREEVG